MGKISRMIAEFKGGDLAVKTKVVAELAMWGCISLCIGKFIVGIFSSSFFIIASAFYTLGMAFARVVYLKGYRNMLEHNKREEYISYIYIACILFGSGLLYGIYMFRFILTDYEFNLGLIPAIAVAAVSFTELTITIISMFKAFKVKDIMFRACAIINLLTAFAAIALTQVCILHSTHEGGGRATNIYNGLFGMVVALSTIIISIFMISKARREIKKLDDANIDS